MAKPQATIPVKINERPAIAALKRLTQAFQSFKKTGTSVGSAVNASMNKMSSVVSKVGGSFTRVIGPIAKAAALLKGGFLAAAGAVGVLGVRALAAADPLDKMALRLGTTAGFIDKMHFAANRSGGTVADMNTALTALARRVAGQPAVFERWGIATRDANGNLLNTESLMRRVATKIQSASTQAEQLAIAQDVMSEAGRKLIPVFQNGTKGLDEMFSSAENLGLVITEFERNAAAKLADRFGILQEQTNSLRRSIGAALAPAVEAFGAEASRVIAQMRSWLVTNREWLNQRIIEYIQWGAETVLPFFATGISLIVKAFKGWQIVIATVQGVINTFFAGLSSLVSQTLGQFEFLAGFVSSDLAGAIGGAKSVAEDFTSAFSEGADQATRDILELDNQIRSIDDSIGAFTAAAATSLRRVANDAKKLGDEFEAAGDKIQPQGTEDGTRAANPLRASDAIKLPKLPDVDLTPLEKVRAKLWEFSEDATDIYSTLGEQIGVMSNGIGAAIAGGIGAALEGTANGLTILKQMLGEMLMSIGRMLIEQGAAALIMGLLSLVGLGNPAGLVVGPIAIAGGAALMAVGSAIKGGSSNPGGGASTSASPGTSAAPAPSFAQAAQLNRGESTSDGAQPMTVNINFNRPVTNERRAAREIGDVLNARQAVLA